ESTRQFFQTASYWALDWRDNCYEAAAIDHPQVVALLHSVALSEFLGNDKPAFLRKGGDCGDAFDFHVRPHTNRIYTRPVLVYMNYAELHCHSCFSLREGASTPLELVMQARLLGYTALAITDHDNLAGAMEFARTAKTWGLKP